MTDRSTTILYDYWRSSASYRVRIALNLLGIRYETRPVDLLAGQHVRNAYRSINPQGLVPTLVVDGQTLTQSLAIIEYLHGITVGSALLPLDLLGQHRVRQLSYALAMDLHPICNLNVVRHVRTVVPEGTVGDGDAVAQAWMQHFIEQGLARFEALLEQTDVGPFCHGTAITMADCCLVPQLFNAERWGVDYRHHSRIVAAAEAARAVEAVAAAHPDNVQQHEPPGPP